MWKSRIGINLLSVFTCLLSVIVSVSAQQDTTLPSWAMGPFIRPNTVNPVLSPKPRKQIH